MSNDRLKFRQFYEGKFHYWGIGVDGCSFVGPVSGGPIRADNTINDQWTGLYDSEWVKVFEGDILGGGQFVPGVVVSVDGSYRVDQGNDNQSDSVLNQWRTGRLTVIGNIHESPDLMERANG